MKNRLGILQREQIEYGKSSGLSEKAIKVYAKSKFNFLQMQEMRMALEEGIPIKEVKKRFKKNLSHDDMERLRKEIKELKKYEEPLDETKILIPYYVSAVVLVIMIMAFVVGSYFVINNKIFLEVKSDMIEVEKNSYINPADYVTYDKRGVLQYNTIDTSDIGEEIIVYTLKKGDDSIVRYLGVNVVDKKEDMILFNDE